MKLSVSLPEEDVRFLDEYAVAEGVDSRSAVVHHAVRLLMAAGLADAYQTAWDEWASSVDAGLWDEAGGDGISP
jgi:Arc/MetJ-type ribon-helix-helix transcriptional regulator